MRLIVLHKYHLNVPIINKILIPFIKRIDNKVNIITSNTPFQIKPLKHEITKYYPLTNYSLANYTLIMIK